MKEQGGMENKRTEKRRGKKENTGKEQETNLQERINHLQARIVSKINT